LRASDYDSAVECCLASLLLWPSKFDSRDSDKSWHLFEQLDLSLNDVENFKDRDSQTGDVVLEQLGDEHDDRLRMVRARWSAYVAKSRRPANTA
jgi:hypothetical protein